MATNIPNNTSHRLKVDASTSTHKFEEKPAPSAFTEPTVSYQLNDFVYIETSISEPFEICQIEGITQKRNGTCELTVRNLCRRQDVPIVMILQAEKECEYFLDLFTHYLLIFFALTDGLDHLRSNADGALHEVYYNSGYSKTYSSTQLRGKCMVVRFEREMDTASSYVKENNKFFYRLKYKNISASNSSSSRGASGTQAFLSPLEESSMRIGPDFQAEVPDFALTESQKKDYYKGESSREELRYTSEHKLKDEEIDKFITICRSLGTYGRAQLSYLAHDKVTSKPPPCAFNVASTSSRDYTTECAMDVLHSYNYDIGAAVKNMVPNNMPAICMENAEKWTDNEVDLFNEGFQKHGKNFCIIRRDYLPWKELSSVVTYYYTWKKSGRIQTSEKSGPRSKRKLKTIAIPESTHNTDSHALSCEKKRKCDSCLVHQPCKTYPCGTLVYALCPECRKYWQCMASFRILDS